MNQPEPPVIDESFTAESARYRNTETDRNAETVQNFSPTRWYGLNPLCQALRQGESGRSLLPVLVTLRAF